MTLKDTAHQLLGTSLFLSNLNCFIPRYEYFMRTLPCHARNFQSKANFIQTCLRKNRFRMHLMLICQDMQSRHCSSHPWRVICLGAADVEWLLGLVSVRCWQVRYCSQPRCYGSPKKRIMELNWSPSLYSLSEASTSDWYTCLSLPRTTSPRQHHTTMYRESTRSSVLLRSCDKEKSMIRKRVPWFSVRYGDQDGTCLSVTVTASYHVRAFKPFFHSYYQNYSLDIVHIFNWRAVRLYVNVWVWVWVFVRRHVVLCRACSIRYD